MLVAKAMLENVQHSLIGFEFLFLDFFLIAFAFARKISDLLCPRVKLAQLFLRISFASNDLSRHIANFLKVADKFFRRLTPAFAGLLPEDIRRGYFASAIIEEHHRLVIQFKRRNIFHFQLHQVALLFLRTGGIHLVQIGIGDLGMGEP